MIVPETITTKRLILRPPASHDAKGIADLQNDETLARNASRIPHPYTEKDAADYIETQRRQWMVEEEFAFVAFLSDALVASAGLRKMDIGWSLGYGVHRDHRGCGIATEIAVAVCEFGFNALGIEKIHAGHFNDNPASATVLKKLGFELTGEHSRTYSKGRGGPVDGVEYVLRKERLKRPGQK